MKSSIKKIYKVALPLIATLSFALGGCGSNNDSANNGIGAPGYIGGAGTVQNPNGSVSVSFSGTAVQFDGTTLLAGQMPTTSGNVNCSQIFGYNIPSGMACFVNKIGGMMAVDTLTLGQNFGSLQGGAAAIGGQQIQKYEKFYAQYDGGVSNIAFSLVYNNNGQYTISGVLTLSQLYMNYELQNNAVTGIAIQYYNTGGGKVFIYTNSNNRSFFVF